MVRKEKYEILVNKKPNLEGDEGTTNSIKLKIKPNFIELLNKFRTNTLIAYDYGQRYRIKTVLTGCGEWNSIYEILFDQRMIDGGEVIIECDLRKYLTISHKLSCLKNLIKQMLDILVEENVKIEIEVTRGERDSVIDDDE